MTKQSQLVVTYGSSYMQDISTTAMTTSSSGMSNQMTTTSDSKIFTSSITTAALQTTVHIICK